LLGRPWVRRVSDVDEPIECAGEASAYGASVVRSAGVANDLKTTAVMALDYSSDQKSDRMRAPLASSHR
jgi:hypothetical protein